jgi:hypothetical protein
VACPGGCHRLQLWSRKLENDRRALAFLNVSPEGVQEGFCIPWKALGWPVDAKAQVRLLLLIQFTRKHEKIEAWQRGGCGALKKGEIFEVTSYCGNRRAVLRAEPNPMIGFCTPTCDKSFGATSWQESKGGRFDYSLLHTLPPPPPEIIFQLRLGVQVYPERPMSPYFLQSTFL